MNWFRAGGVVFGLMSLGPTLEGISDRAMYGEAALTSQWVHALVALVCMLMSAFFFGMMRSTP